MWPSMTPIRYFCIAFTMLLFSRPVNAQNAAQRPDEWQIRLTPYVYVPSADADLEISGREGKVELSSSDVVNYLDFMAMGSIKAPKGRWALLFDGIFFNLEIPAHFENAATGTTTDLALDERLGRTDFGLSYQLADLRLDADGVRRIVFEPYGGFRYAYLRQAASLNLSLDGPASVTIGHSEDWVEPFVGGRIGWQFNETIGFDLKGDAGGFGIGSASDLAWQIAFQLDYRLSERISLNAGYRVIDLDYHHGSGSDALGIDVRAKGPFIGLTLVF